MNSILILWGKHPQHAPQQWKRLDKDQRQPSLDALRADGWELTQLMPGVSPPAPEKKPVVPIDKQDLFSQYI